jgi:hypothetical protein
MARQELTFRFKVDKRIAEVKAYDSVGVEDAMNVQMQAAMHRILTNEDWTEPVAREVKDFIIKTNLFI